MPNFLIAPDSFKGSLSAVDFCKIATQAIHDLLPDAKVVQRPMSDGGEGFVDAFVTAGLAERHTLDAANANGQKTSASFAWQAETKTALIEMAQASGLPQIKPNQRNPMQANTYGTGTVIQAALNLGAEKIILGLGGSATNDGGMGALNALGFKFLDQRNKEVMLGGQGLKYIQTIQPPENLPKVEWLLACDVTNPLLGESGATAVFGPQKGVTEQTFSPLESGLANWAAQILACTGKDVKDIPGSGAAGGMAAGFIGLLNAQLAPGFDILNQALQLEQTLKQEDIDYVITGEGRMDEQSKFGKLPVRIAELAAQYQIPTLAFCGKFDGRPQDFPQFKSVMSISNGPNDELSAFAQTPDRLYDSVYTTIQLIR